MSSKIVDIVPDVKRFNSFVVFEPHSLRVSPGDIFLEGEKVQEFFDELIDKIMSKELSLKEHTLLNRLSKPGQMLELLSNYDNVIITKQFDRIWRRYAQISHLGEHFIDLATLLEHFPEYNDDYVSVVADRHDGGDDFDEESEDQDSDDDSDENEEESSEDKK